MLHRGCPRLSSVSLFKGVQVNGGIRVNFGTVVVPKMAVKSGYVVKYNAVIARSVPTGSVMINIPNEIVRSINRCTTGRSSSFVRAGGVTASRGGTFMLNRLGW